MIFKPLLHGCGFVPVQDDNQQPRMLIEIDNVIGMIESMLSFARDDARHEPRTLVDVSALTEDICLDAVDAGEPVTYSGPRGITISCRPTALRRAISNLMPSSMATALTSVWFLSRSALSSLLRMRGRVYLEASVNVSLTHSIGSRTLAIPTRAA
jgi:hypothetical protein